jgi:4-amino-4-deoxy-L-arabinose transferase-like glycosyltransferase
MSWLLPFGLFGAALLLLGTRLAWPIGSNHQSLVVWGGWLLTGAVFFSAAGFFHEYYLSILGPPLAVLVAAGASRLWQIGDRRLRFAAALLLVAAAFTLVFQVTNASAFVANFPWIIPALLLFALGAGLLLLGAWRARLPLAVSGVVLVLAAPLVIPAAWSFLTAQNASSNQSLPSAYGGSSQGTRLDGGLSGLNANPTLLSFLEENTQGMKYLMAVPSSMQGADYVLASGRPVLYLGGFNGQDAVLTLAQFQALVSDGELRYVYTGEDGRGGPGGASGNNEITGWVQSNCSAVSGFETQTRNAGAPDGATGGSGGFPAGGNFNLLLYDCGL